ncbi:peptidylprolyl isomerase [Marilutibacter chinensis]|uniref:Chaperone SurA n=1 Tax=Marilutibacter chinensis TaxID=2912247 RepID=A0ABS9HUT4_9GAMM|nr:peptidylprolyl isomerase [Lysobacter chinensis]MCF7221927.1 peptidylprolyl isomerase [Lysobacter chinensis]
MKKYFACALAAALFASSVQAQQAPPQPVQGQTIDGIVAIVDEDVILRSELDRAAANILAQYAGREGQLPPRDVLERQVLERLVLVKLQVARAEGTGVRVNNQEIDGAIANIAGQNGISVDQLSRQLARDGTSYEEFRQSVRDELMVQKLRQRYAQSRISVSDAEIDAAMEAQQAGGAQYHLAHILVALPDGATPEQIDTAQRKIEGIKGLLDRGEMDFAAAAVRYSDSPNALEGGDLGWRSLDEIPSAFVQMVRNMAPGAVSQPLRGPSGFQLLQMVETRDADAAGDQMVTQYKARHILIRVDENTSDAEAKARIDTLAARLAGGADFETLAREESQDLNSKSRGGDLGWFNADAFGLEFGGQVTRLADGQVSAPFRSSTGWHIVERTGSRQTNVTDQNRRNQIAETIGRRKLEDEWNRFLRELRGEAYVDLRVGQPAATDASSGG